jgi:hypothetical protein
VVDVQLLEIADGRFNFGTYFAVVSPRVRVSSSWFQAGNLLSRAIDLSISLSQPQAIEQLCKRKVERGAF